MWRSWGYFFGRWISRDERVGWVLFVVVVGKGVNGNNELKMGLKGDKGGWFLKVYKLS